MKTPLPLPPPGASSSSRARCAPSASTTMCLILFFDCSAEYDLRPRLILLVPCFVSSTRTDARASAVLLPHLAPATDRTPTLPPPAPVLLQARGTQSARARSRCHRTPMGTTPIPTPRPQRTRSHTLNPHTKLQWPRPRGVCRRRPPRVLRQGRHHLRAAAVVHLPISYTSPSPSTDSTHAVTFPVSPNRYASLPTPTPTYVSTLTPPTPRGTPMSPGTIRSVSSSPAPVSVSVRTSPAPGGSARAKSGSRGKRRSPVKGLFLFSLSSALSASATQTSTPCPIRVPLPPLVCVDGDAPDEDDEDAWPWVDGDDDQTTTIRRRTRGRGKMRMGRTEK
ncbi:hypothetical protein B0H14DRAFT_655615 [Mycena olivaceomarginata]|nr:hypothetical protein B0H14DRAFT_655615 [Mycena olivaceomarginata]